MGAGRERDTADGRARAGIVADLAAQGLVDPGLRARVPARVLSGAGGFVVVAEAVGASGKGHVR